MAVRKKAKEKLTPVSIVVPMRNASTTVLICLESLVTQDYPIREIVVVDNASTDDSVAIVKKICKEK